MVVGKEEGVKGVVVRREERRGSFCDGLVDEWEGNVHLSSSFGVRVVMLVMLMILMITMTINQVQSLLSPFAHHRDERSKINTTSDKQPHV